MSRLTGIPRPRADSDGHRQGRRAFAICLVAKLECSSAHSRSATNKAPGGNPSEEAKLRRALGSTLEIALVRWYSPRRQGHHDGEPLAIAHRDSSRRGILLAFRVADSARRKTRERSLRGTARTMAQVAQRHRISLQRRAAARRLLQSPGRIGCNLPSPTRSLGAEQLCPGFQPKLPQNGPLRLLSPKGLHHPHHEQLPVAPR